MGARPVVTVCGSGAAGRAIAADLSLKGLEVRLFELAQFEERLRPIARARSLYVSADSDTTSGKTGCATLARVTTDAQVAAEGADLIMVTVPAMYHDVFVDELLPGLSGGQIVLFNTGYWAGLRQTIRLGSRVPEGLVFAESNIMPYICEVRGADGVRIGRYKRHFSLAAFPGNRIDQVHEVAGQAYTQYRPVPSVLDTNVAAAGNPPIHATLAIPVAGYYFDRYMGGRFYQDATAPGARLVTAHDEERRRLSQALGLGSFETQFDFDKRSYGYQGRDIAEALRSSPHADWFATAEYLEQVVSEDLIYGYVPMVHLADALGVSLPVTRAMVDIVGAMLGRNYWDEGLSLADLGLEGLDREGIERFVVHGAAA